MGKMSNVSIGNSFLMCFLNSPEVVFGKIQGSKRAGH